MSNTIQKLTITSLQVEEIKKSFRILEATRTSVDSFLITFRKVRTSIGRSRKKYTSTTDEQQDILRAMLVFSAAGLDSCLKQLIRDSLPKLAQIDDSVQNKIETFCAKHIKGDQEIQTQSSKFLSRILFSESTKTALIEEYINYLTGSSLQSYEELFKVYDALNISSSYLNKEELKSIFNARNNIIHELDIDFSSTRRSRFQRKKKEMIEYSNNLIKIGDEIISKVNEKILAN